MAEYGSLSNQLSGQGSTDKQETAKSDKKHENIIEELEKKLEYTTEQLKRSQETIEQLRKTIQELNKGHGNSHEKDSITNEAEANVTDILRYKNAGFERQCPQTESKKRNDTNHLICDICKSKFESPGQLKAHKETHEEKCDICGSKCKDRNELSTHMNDVHSCDTEFNCNDCCFQAQDKEQLDKHLLLTQHNEVEKLTTNIKTSFTCHTCGSSFSNKPDMMNHRKSMHPEIIKTCRRFLKGICAYADEICWYGHSLNKERASETSANIIAEFECKFCKKVFESKSEFMKHRKAKHPQVVKQCRDSASGSCRFSDEECWYIHYQITDSISDKAPTSNFHQDLNRQPPDQDLMQRIISMLEKVSARVNKIENAQKS